MEGLCLKNPHAVLGEEAGNAAEAKTTAVGAGPAVDRKALTVAPIAAAAAAAKKWAVWLAASILCRAANDQVMDLYLTVDSRRRGEEEDDAAELARSLRY